MPPAEAQAIPEAVLEVVDPDGTRRVVRVTHTPFSIGRGAAAGNELQLVGDGISRHSALLVCADGVFRLEDRGQKHGLFVNGEKIQVRELHDGDEITFRGGDSPRLIFRAGQQAVPELLTRLERAATLDPGARDLRQLSLPGHLYRCCRDWF